MSKELIILNHIIEHLDEDFLEKAKQLSKTMLTIIIR